MTLPAWLAGHGISRDDLARYGVTVADQELAVPVHAVGGEVAFTLYRDLSGTRLRYRVAPEGTRRGLLLYGLTHALASIRAAGFAVLVEGFSDAIACQQHGLPQAVGMLGRKPSKVQLATACLLAPRVVLWSDGDAAGAAAAQEFLAGGGSGCAAFTVPGADPAELVARGVDPSELVAAALQLARSHPGTYVPLDPTGAIYLPEVRR